MHTEQDPHDNAHAGSRARVTSMGGLYDTATLHALRLGSAVRINKDYATSAATVRTDNKTNPKTDLENWITDASEMSQNSRTPTT